MKRWDTEKKIYYGPITPAPTTWPTPVAAPQAKEEKQSPSDATSTAQWLMVSALTFGLAAMLLDAVNLSEQGLNVWPYAIYSGLRWAAITTSAILTIKLVAKSGVIGALWERVVWWLERRAKTDIDGDGDVGEPEARTESPISVPSEAEGQIYWESALALWNYAQPQLVAAKKDDRKWTRGRKPWSKRAGHGLEYERWSMAMTVWCGGLLIPHKDAQAKDIATIDYKTGYNLIRDGMSSLGYMSIAGNWYPR
ncbi:MAG: hypothetical protein DRQ02_01390 [Candidatus Latescibacterota bacterium]|nr:MAG: hypothetical protein DRQ02_01390 [Candidatus Latescibacterota bacterium]